MLEIDEISNSKEAKSIKSSSNSPLFVSTPKVGRKLSGLSLLLDEDARIKSSASVSPVNASNTASSGIKPTLQCQFENDTKTLENITGALPIAHPKALPELLPTVAYGSFFESYKSDDMELLPDHYQLPLTPHPPNNSNTNNNNATGITPAPAKSDKSHRAFSFDFEEEEIENNEQEKHEKDAKEYLTCQELINLILGFANTNDEFTASPSSRSLWHMTSVRLVAADEKGEALNDLPLDLSATADVLNLGVTDFIIVDRYGDRTLMHIRIEGLLHGNLPYAGTTTSVIDMPYTSLNFDHNHEGSSHHDEMGVATERHRQLLLRSQQLHSDSSHETSLTLGSSEDSSGSSFDTVRRQTSLESLAPDVITVFQMDTDDKTSVSQAMDQQHPSALSSPSSIEHNAQTSKKKKRKHRRKQEKQVSNSHAYSHNSNRFSYGTSNVVSSLSASSPVTRGRSSSGNLFISCRRWGTDRWRVAQEIALSPRGSVLWDHLKPAANEKDDEDEENKFNFSLSEREEEKNYRPFQFNNAMDINPNDDDVDGNNESNCWFDDFSYSSHNKTMLQDNNNVENNNTNKPFASKYNNINHINQSCPVTPLRKPRASSSLSASYNSRLHYIPTHSTKDKQQNNNVNINNSNNKQSSFFNNVRNDELLKQHYLEKQQAQHKPLFLHKKPSSSIILVPAAGDPGLERRHSERPYDEDHDVIDILKYQRHTPSVLALEKAGALQTIFPHTSQPFHAKFSPKYTPNNSNNDTNNTNINKNMTNNDTTNNTNNNANTSAVDNSHYRERRIRAMSSLSNTSTRSDTGYDSDCEHFYINSNSSNNNNNNYNNNKKKKDIVRLEHVEEVLHRGSVHNLSDNDHQHHAIHSNYSTKSDNGYSYEDEEVEKRGGVVGSGNVSSNNSEHSAAAILSAAVLSSAPNYNYSSSNNNSINNSHNVSASTSTSATAAMLLSHKSLAAQRSVGSQQNSVSYNMNNNNSDNNKLNSSNRSVSLLPSSTSSKQGSEHTPTPIINNNTSSYINTSNFSSNNAVHSSSNIVHRPQHHHHPHLSSHSHQTNFIHTSPHHFHHHNNNNGNINQKPPTHHRKHTTPPLCAPPQGATLYTTSNTTASLDEEVLTSLPIPPPLHLLVPEDTTVTVSSVPSPQYNSNSNKTTIAAKKTSKSAVSSGYSTPTYSTRTSFTSFLSPTNSTNFSTNNNSDSRRGSSNFFGRLYDSLVRMSSPAIATTNENTIGSNATDDNNIHNDTNNATENNDNANDTHHETADVTTNETAA